MKDAILTKSADELLCGLYKVFCQREKAGELRKKSRYFKIPQDVQGDLLRELHKVGFIRHAGWDGLTLEDAAIIYMENRPGIVDVSLDALSRIKSAIPFV